MPVFRFECECGWSGDRLADAGQTYEPCPACERKAAKQFSPPKMLAIVVAGVEGMDAIELQGAYENKAWLESRADEVHSGAIELRTKSTVPLEVRPNIPKRFH